MNTTLSNDARLAAAFAQMAQLIRKETHNDASIFAMLAQIIPVNPTFAYSLAQHIADVLNEHHEAVDYNEVLVEAYRRALFDPLHAQKHGSDYFEGDPARAEEFVHAMHTIHDAGSLQLLANASRYLN
jgi:hypothetical protein